MEKKLSKKAIICIVCAAVVVVAAAITITICALSKNSNVTSIVIKDSDMPLSTYVQGQELDLSDGVITAIMKKSEIAIPLTDSEVSISGYDKNVLGKQTITVTYKGLTTTFEVTVVSSVVADGYRTEYFIGDEFDASKGKLKITKTDGKTTTIPFNNEFITATFNNETAGDSLVTVVYNDNQGTVYETSFTVKCYEIGEIVNFVKPSKTIYQSHDTALNLGGGYLQVKAKNADYSAIVSLTDDMISGFNPALTQPQHTNKNPLVQTITCTYSGLSKTFTVSLIYSSVSIVLDAAKALANVNVTDENFTLDSNLSDIAVKAAVEYFKLTNDKKALISEDDVLKVMRPAAFCVSKALLDAAEVYKNIFKIDPSSGDILINAQSKEDLTNLKDVFNTKDDPFTVYADVLTDMSEDFADVVIFTKVDDKGESTDITFASFVKAPNSDQRSFYKDLFNHMIIISEKLDTIPSDWSMNSGDAHYLGNYESTIQDAFNTIVNSRFAGPTFHGPYNSISSWRGNDFYEIFYRYYLEIANKTTKEDFLKAFNNAQGFKFPLPGELQTWYNYVNAAYSEVVKRMVVTNNGETTYYALYDTTLFMYYYNKVLDITANIMDGENELDKAAFNIINGDMMIYNYLEAPYTTDKDGNIVHPNGYLFFTMMAPDSKAVNQLRASYIEIISLYFENNLRLDELNTQSEKLNKMFENLAKLSPSELYAFISSVNFFYNRGDEFVFDYSEKYFNYFTLLVGAYEDQSFTSENILPLRQLLKAMELCAQIGVKSTVEEFREAMLALKAAVESDAFNADRDAFMEIAGDCYEKYLGICNTLTEPQDFGGFEDEYNELKATLTDYFTIYNFLNNPDLSESQRQERAKYYLLLFSLSEKAVRLHAALADAPAEVKNALNTVSYALNGTESMTMETAYTILSSNFYGQLIGRLISINGSFAVSFWNVYANAPKVRDMMANLASPLMNYYNGETVDIATVTAIMEAFRTFNLQEKTIFDQFDSVKSAENTRQSLYSDLILDAFTKNNESIKDFVTALLHAEYGYAIYITDTTDSSRVSFFTRAMDDLIAKYPSGTIDEALKDMYDFYKAVYDEINTDNSSNS